MWHIEFIGNTSQPYRGLIFASSICATLIQLKVWKELFLTPVYVVEVTLKFTDPDQTRFALSAASQLGPFKQRRLGKRHGEEGGTARDGASVRKMEEPSLASKRK